MYNGVVLSNTWPLLMSTLAHKSLMSMLMRLLCAHAHGGVKRTPTLGQDEVRTVQVRTGSIKFRQGKSNQVGFVNSKQVKRI